MFFLIRSPNLTKRMPPVTFVITGVAMAAIMNCTQPAALIHLPLSWTGTQPGPCSSLVPIPRSGQSACGIRVLGLAEWKKKGRIRCSDRPGNAAELEAISGEAQFEEVLLEAQRTDTTIVIEWMAKWCRKCIYLKPQLEKLAMEFQQGAKFYFVDVNAVPQALVKRAGVTKMPTIQLWKNKEKKGEIIAGQKVWLVVDEVREMVRASQGLDVAI